MKCIKTFNASRVYDYLDMNIKFFDDLTILYGLNGSGKTTALRLIMGLLQPSLKTLISIPFRSIRLSGVTKNNDKVEIWARKNKKLLTLRCSSFKGSFRMPVDVSSEELDERFSREFFKHETIQAIQSISSPMFLGIDRRFITPRRPVTRKEMPTSHEMAMRYRHERMYDQYGDYDPGLAEVAEMIDNFVRQLRIRQEKVNNQFRKQLFLESFSYVDPTSHGFSLDTPQEEVFNVFRSKRKAITSALQSLSLTSEEFEQKTDQFFTTIEKVITTIKRRSKKGKQLEFDKELSDALTAWFVNQSQVDRIDRLFDTASKYQEQAEEVYKPLNDFVSLINGFFSQTGKEVLIGREGAIRIKMPHRTTTSLQALSSGERQIFIMLAHLSLNPQLLRDGVFIVDEPELSLHIAWQDMFIDAAQKANARLQLILATHAPAIIGGRNNHCVPVSM